MDPSRDLSSVVALMRRRAEDNEGKIVYTFLLDGEADEMSLTYGALDRQARAIAVALRERISFGDRALLLYPPGLDFISGFFGCLYAGVIAVPAYPPDPSRLQRTLPRLQAMARDAGARIILTTSVLGTMSGSVGELAPQLTALPWLATDDIDYAAASDWRQPSLDDHSIAFIQYTSGSTGDPKGVVLTHGNLIANTAASNRAFQFRPDDIMFSWLPLYHDMGLIGVTLAPLHQAIPTVLMSPLAFLQRPSRWVRGVSRSRATLSGAPNFAYDLCARKTTEAEKLDIDLRSWTMAFCGAEPLRRDTLERFCAAFESSGFNRAAITPCYGLAESTLAVSNCRRHDPFVSTLADGPALGSGVLQPPGPEPQRALTLVSSGQALDDTEIVIVDPVSHRLRADGEVGEVWVAGPSVAAGGYWGREAETIATFHARVSDSQAGPFLRTGDLGVMRDGELFVTGRCKDLIIVRGRNLFPQDLERIAESAHSAVRPGSGAAFSLAGDDGEELVLVYEIADHTTVDPDVVIDAMRAALTEELGVQPNMLVLIERGAVPKTSSGKIQRRACRDALLDDALPVVKRWSAPKADTPASEPAPTRSAAAVTAWLADRLAARLGLAREHVDPRREFANYGVDSAHATALAGELEDWTGRRLPATLLYEYPTIEAVARHLAGESAGPAARWAAPTAPEPIAIVGIGCRFPGAAGPQAFWRLLRDGSDAISEVPQDRWDAQELYDPDPLTPGKTNSRWGGFVDNAQGFDTAFFGIARREATRLDPQQRFVLEVAWEALEDAGLVAERLAGSRTGVFLGISTNDYGRLILEELGHLQAYDGSGNALSVAANRLSYFLDLRGPSMAVDTACSSSLVAVHLACQSLARGECELAFAGGANLILSPALAIAFSKAGFLAADGRCKTFDARADGYVRGEGVGFVLLKRLSRAVADRDRIYAVVGGSAVGQDGRTNGLMAPSQQAQEGVLRAAYEAAGVSPSDVQYVEAHGTGTLLGDPIEAAALGAVVGCGRTADRACAVGSVKTNIGHLEAAAGIAGLIKTALALHHGEIPASLHFEKPNPHISFAQLGLRVNDALTPWSAAESVRVAGVSSFGFGGTNAHVVVESAPLVDACQGESQEERTEHFLPISARSPEALVRLAGEYRELLRDPDGAPAPSEISYSAALRRSHHDYRLAVVGRSNAELADRLGEFLSGSRTPGWAAGRAGAMRPRIAFVFSDEGSQWVGMGRELLASEPIFAAALHDCDRAIRACVDWSLLDVLADPAPTALDAVDVSQPAIFAIQFALASIWRAWGITPDAVVGHGLGEVAAAAVAGELSLEDAAAVVCQRSAPHSQHSDAPRRELERALGGLRPAVGSVPFYSTVTGRAMDGERLGAEYWGRNLREPVLFWPAVEQLLANEHAIFLEVSPHPVLLVALQDGLRQLAPAAVGLASLRRDQPEHAALLGSLAALFANGCPLEWQRMFRNGGTYVPLPSYPWQHERIWLDDESLGRARRNGRRQGHPLLGSPVQAAESGYSRWQSELDTESVGYLEDHKVGGTAVLPGAAFVELALAASARCHQREATVLRGIEIRRALLLTGLKPRPLRVTAKPSGDDLRVEIESETGHEGVAEAGWTSHASATIVAQRLSRPASDTTVAQLRSRCTEPVEIRQFYATLESHGLAYGPAFRGMEAVWRGDHEALARVSLPDEVVAGADAYEIHPAALDACFQVLAAAIEWADAERPAEPYVLAGIEELRFFGSVPAGVLWAHGRVVGEEQGARIVADLSILDASGRLLCEARSIRLQPLAEATPKAAPLLDDCYFKTEWVPLPASVWTPTNDEGSWLILGDRGGAGAALGGLLAKAGEDSVIVTYDGKDGGFDPASPDAIRQVFEESFGSRRPCRGVVHLCNLGSPPDAEMAAETLRGVHERGIASLLYVVKESVRLRQRQAPRLWVVTRGAQSVHGEKVAVAQAPAWGLARVIAQEHPELRCTRIDLDPSWSAGAAHSIDELWRELHAELGEDQVALRNGERFALRLLRGQAPAESAHANIHPDATYLITGGLGGVGLSVAEVLVESGARHLVLVARSAPTSEAQSSLARLKESGAHVVVRHGDVTDTAQMATLFAEFGRGMPPLRGVVHAAGILDDGILLNLDGDRLRRVLAPKTVGAWNLHVLSATQPLDFFVLFSSVASILGSPGQGSYTAANAFLDALAHHRRALKRPGLSINWGPWSVGMAARAGGASLRASGVDRLTPGEGKAAFLRLLAASVPQAAVVRVDLGRWRHLSSAATPNPLLRELLAESEVPTSRSDAPLSHALAGVTDRGERARRIEAQLREHMAEVLGVDAVRIDGGAPLFDLGFDSLMMVELRHQIEASTGVLLPASSVFNYPTLVALVQHLGELLDTSDGSTKTAEPGPGDGNGAMAALDELSDEELANALAAELAPVERGV